MASGVPLDDPRVWDPAFRVGKVVVSDQHGSRLIPWQDAATVGPAGRSQFKKPEPIASGMARMKATAPPIRKTTGLEKSRKLTEMFENHITVMRAGLGRPPTVGDLSEPMRRALGFHRLSDQVLITADLLRRAANRHLTRAENEMRAIQNKRVTKEPFWVPAGIR